MISGVTADGTQTRRTGRPDGPSATKQKQPGENAPELPGQQQH